MVRKERVRPLIPPVSPCRRLRPRSFAFLKMSSVIYVKNVEQTRGFHGNSYLRRQCPDFFARPFVWASSGHMNGRMFVIAAAITVSFQIGCIRPTQKKRVIVSLPEQWQALDKWPLKEQQNCVLGGDDPVTRLPRLDCDLQAPNTPTPRSRMFVVDAEFSTTPERQLYVEWVCKRTNGSLVCTN